MFAILVFRCATTAFGGYFFLDTTLTTQGLMFSFLEGLANLQRALCISTVL